MANDFCQIETWTVAELINSLSEEPNKRKRTIIPKYQRNLVWSESQKKSFIDSLKSGFPFGSLLVYQSSVENDITNYSLVDGLQRTTTIRNYVTKPLEFFGEENINEDIPKSILGYLHLNENESREELIKIIKNWIKSKTGFKMSDGWSSHRLVREIFSNFNIPSDSELEEKIDNIIIPFLEGIAEDSNISDVKIPIIIYTGSKINLPTIFGRLNSKGTSLNKYQIYAATWSTHEPINITNTEIIDLIKAKYDALIEEGLEIENYDPDSIYTEKFNVFEYVFGLGKLFSKKYPFLFGDYDTESKDNTESIGFNLCTVCLGLDLSEMGHLPEKLLNINREEFEKAIFESIDLVNAKLKPYVSLKANKKKSRASTSTTIYHSEYQIISLIGKVFLSKYQLPELTEKEAWSSIKTGLLENIPFHYLYDILREYWRGSGDSKIKDLVKDGSRYENELKMNSWNNVLSEWFNNQLIRQETTRVNIKDSDLLFLKYIYTHLLTSYEENSDNEFEIEHLVPVNKMKKVLKDKGGKGVPIGIVSNLCLIKKELNNIKKDKTIYQYFKECLDNDELSEDQARLEIGKTEKFSFTSAEDLAFAEVNISKKELGQEQFDVKYEEFENQYYSFIKARFEKLKEIFFEKNNITD